MDNSTSDTQNAEPLNEADVRQALQQTEGNLSWAAARFGVTRTHLTHFIKATPALQALLATLQEAANDDAESGLFDAVFAGEHWAICFCLKTLGRKRGYGKPLNAAEEAAMPKAPVVPLFLDRMKKISKEQGEIMNRLGAIACGGRFPDEPAYFQRLVAAGAGVRDAIVQYHGNLARAAKQLGVSRSELKEYAREMDDLDVLVFDLHEEMIDNAEAALDTAARKNEPWAIKFRLQYCSQGRGFSKYPQPQADPPASPYKLPEWLGWDWDRLNFDQLEEIRQISESLGIDPRKPPNPCAKEPNRPVSRDAKCSERSAGATTEIGHSSPIPDRDTLPPARRDSERSVSGTTEVGHSSPAPDRETAPPVSRDAKSSERSAGATAEVGHSSPTPDRGAAPSVSRDRVPARRDGATTEVGRSSPTPYRDAAPNPSPKSEQDDDAPDLYESFPEDAYEEYVDEDTEMEIVLSRVFSGPDLEKALGRKPRLGLTSDKPYDCPIDPATGLLKKRLEPPLPPGEPTN